MEVRVVALRHLLQCYQHSVLRTVGNVVHGIAHSAMADATISSLVVINLGVMVYKLRTFEKKMDAAELL